MLQVCSRRHLATAHADDVMDGAVKFNNAVAPCLLVQPVDVLRDERLHCAGTLCSLKGSGLDCEQCQGKCECARACECVVCVCVRVRACAFRLLPRCASNVAEFAPRVSTAPCISPVTFVWLCMHHQVVPHHASCPVPLSRCVLPNKVVVLDGLYRWPPGRPAHSVSGHGVDGQTASTWMLTNKDR